MRPAPHAAMLADRQHLRERQTGRQRDRQAERQAERQAGRQRDRQAGRETGRQTDICGAGAVCLGDITAWSDPVGLKIRLPHPAARG